MPDNSPLDTLQSSIYLRVTAGPTPNLQPALTNARVDLYELDDPAAAGDDVVIPATGESEKITQKFDITEVRQYQPSADQLLGTGMTDQDGLVTFTVVVNSSGGTLRDTTTTRDLHTDSVISTHTVTTPIPEKKPDYGVTITASDGAVMAKRMLIALNVSGNQLGTPDNPFPVRILTSVVSEPTNPSVAVGIPVRNARRWTTGLAPDNAGGWHYITEIYELHDPYPPQWVVVNLQSGVARSFDGVPKIYANHSLRIGNQLRAANGRIFFPCSSNYVAYYDPADDQMHFMPQIMPPNHQIDNIIYKAVFGPDGKIYGATQASGLKKPMVFQLDPEPDPPTVRVLGNVGKDRESYSYGYDVYVDPPWVYVAVGELPWELAALNIDTGVMTMLRKVEGSAPWIKLSADDKGVIATLITNLGSQNPPPEKRYLANGLLHPYPFTGDFAPRDVTPFSNAIMNPVDIDDSDGAGFVSWRPYQSQEPWTKVEYTVNHKLPIPIESLAALPDGTLIGNAEQYNGFWRYNPAPGTGDGLTWYGLRSGIDVSRPELQVSNGLLYIAGYPNGVLFSYDWTKPWGWVNPQDSTDRTPKRLGDFHQKSRIKYARHLISGSNHQLYCAGHRERDGKGTGIGSYDETGHQFAGQDSKPPIFLNFVEPRGLVEIGGNIVLSSKVIGNSLTNAELVTYTYDLEPISQAIVKVGALDTGRLFKISDAVLMGVVTSTPTMTTPATPDGPGWVYLFNVSTATLLLVKEFNAQLGAATQRGDGSVWLMCGRAITRVDPVTLETRIIGMLSAPASHMAWVGDDLYLSVGPELRVVRACHSRETLAGVLGRHNSYRHRPEPTGDRRVVRIRKRPTHDALSDVAL